MIIFSSYKFFDVMEGSSANVLFQVTAFSKSYNGKRGRSYFTTLIRLFFLLPTLICTKALLEHLLNLVTLNYMLLYQSFVRTSFKLGNTQLYVTDNGVHCLTFLLVEQLFLMELLNSLNLLCHSIKDKNLLATTFPYI